MYISENCIVVKCIYRNCGYGL